MMWAFFVQISLSNSIYFYNNVRISEKINNLFLKSFLVTLDMPKFSSRSLAALEGVHPDLVKVMKTAIVGTPIDFTIIEGVRTTKRQQELYAQGRDGKGGSIVTYADGVKNKSNHQVKSDGYGHAIDFCPYVNGKLDWNTISNFRTITHHIKATANLLGIKVVCGIDWKRPYDPPHVQLG